MKNSIKSLASLTALLFVVTLFMSNNASAQGRGFGAKGIKAGTGTTQGLNWVDKNGDGICDNFVDANGDGINDNPKGRGYGKGNGTGVCTGTGTCNGTGQGRFGNKTATGTSSTVTPKVIKAK